MINVKDESTNTPLTIYYKLRDKWSFKIAAGLTIKNVIFDALDSIVDPSADTSSYLKQEAGMCTYSETIFTDSTAVCYTKYPL